MLNLRSIIIAFTLLIIVYLNDVDNASAQATNPTVSEQKIILKDKFNKLSFNVELNKSEYLPLEPIFIQMKVSNETDKPLSLPSIPDFKRLFVEIISDGVNRTVGSLFLIGPGRSSFPVILKKGQSLKNTAVLETNLSKMFPKCGQYRVRFVLDNGRSEELLREIKSDVKEITIKEPTGIDRESVEFLRSNLDQPSDTLFWWKNQSEERELLETFVQKYGQSKIGEYAIFQLGISYSNGGKLEKAQAEFEKVKNSGNKYIADNANEALVEIEKRKANLQNAQQQKQN